MTTNLNPNALPTGKLRLLGWDRETKPLAKAEKLSQGNLVVSLFTEDKITKVKLCGHLDVPWGVAYRSTRNPYDTVGVWSDSKDNFTGEFGKLLGGSKHIISVDTYFTGDASLPLAKDHAEIKAGDRIEVAGIYRHDDSTGGGVRYHDQTEYDALDSTLQGTYTHVPGNAGKVDKYFQKSLTDGTGTYDTIIVTVGEHLARLNRVVGYATQDVAAGAGGNVPVHLTIRSGI